MMNSALRPTSRISIALGQLTATEDHGANREKALRLMADAREQGAAGICFPEMSCLPFFPRHSARYEYYTWAEPVPGPTTRTFSGRARDLGLVTLINLYEEDRPGEYYDTTAVLDQDGSFIGKQHMMHIAEEPGYNEKFYYKPGKTGYPVFQTSVGPIGVAICYDRHFPEQIRILAEKGAQILFVPTAVSRGEAFEAVYSLEMQAAAVANGVYIAVANRVGSEPPLEFFGQSFIVDPFGQVIAELGAEEDALLIAEVDVDRIREARQHFPFLRDRRPETYGELLERF